MGRGGFESSSIRRIMGRGRLRAGLALVLLASLLVAVPAVVTPIPEAGASSPGAVDATFKANVGSTMPSRTRGIAVQSDGAVVALGDTTGKLRRYSSAGVADSTFNTSAAAAAGGGTILKWCQ